MTTGLDADTGLPELPEGYFWRVIESPYEFSDKELLVQICHTVTFLEDVYETRPLPKTWRRFFGSEVRGTETVKVGEKDCTKTSVKASAPMMDKHTCQTRGEDRQLREEDKEWCYARNQSFYGERHILVRLWAPTPENILKAAEIALKYFNEDEAEKKKARELEEARQAVIGIYPPKKLEL